VISYYIMRGSPRGGGSGEPVGLPTPYEEEEARVATAHTQGEPVGLPTPYEEEQPAGGAYPGGKGGNGGKGKGKGKGKGDGRTARPLSQATLDALKVAYPNDPAASFDSNVLFRKKWEWLQQWPDVTASRGHCFFKEKLQLECVNSRCPACN
jgi:hypothetical protein